MRKVVLAFVTLMFVASCGDSAVTSSKDIVFPSKNVSYLLQVEPFLKVTCAYQGCHSNETRAGNISLADYNSLVSVAGLIIPGNPDASQLNQMLEEKLPHPGLTYLYRGNDNQIKGMRIWVAEGANP